MSHSRYDAAWISGRKPGESILIAFWYRRPEAFLSGEFFPGQSFPSVRALAAELKIHPNTAHKVVQHLIQERWLEVHPGIGTVVSPNRRKRGRAKSGCCIRRSSNWWWKPSAWAELAEVVEAIGSQWTRLIQGRRRRSEMIIQTDDVWKKYGRFEALQGAQHRSARGQRLRPDRRQRRRQDPPPSSC